MVAPKQAVRSAKKKKIWARVGGAVAKMKKKTKASGRNSNKSRKKPVQRPATNPPRVKTVLRTPSKKVPLLTQTRVYVLELRGGYVYVGKTSRGVQTRLEEHCKSTKSRFSGSAFTRLHPPTGRLLPRLGNLEGDGDGPERDETLRQMHKRGAQRVRGWKYVRPGPLTAQELDEIQVWV